MGRVNQKLLDELNIDLSDIKDGSGYGNGDGSGSGSG